MSDTSLLADYLDLEPFAKEVDRTTRTVRRWIDAPGGLPYVRLGNRILIHVPSAREWLFGRMQNQKPARAHRQARRLKRGSGTAR
jgi:hypothetical protein